MCICPPEQEKQAPTTQAQPVLTPISSHQQKSTNLNGRDALALRAASATKQARTKISHRIPFYFILVRAKLYHTVLLVSTQYCIYYIIISISYFILYIIYCILYLVSYILYRISYIVNIIYYISYIISLILYIIYYVLYIINYKLYIIYYML